MVLNAITNRKSVRVYNDQLVADEDIKSILNCGIMAPSWVNVQPWQFVVVRNQEHKDILSQAAGGQKQVSSASAVICCIADMSAWNADKFAKIMEKQGRNSQTIDYILSSTMLNPSLLGEYETLLRTVEQMSYAIGYMTLRAEELGIGCCIVGAVSNELTTKDKNTFVSIKEMLGLNEKQVLLSMLTLGYEKEFMPVKKSRKDFDEVVSLEKLGSKF